VSQLFRKRAVHTRCTGTSGALPRALWCRYHTPQCRGRDRHPTYHRPSTPPSDNTCDRWEWSGDALALDLALSMPLPRPQPSVLGCPESVGPHCLQLLLPISPPRTRWLGQPQWPSGSAPCRPSTPATAAMDAAVAYAIARTCAATVPVSQACACAIAAACLVAVDEAEKPFPPTYPSPTRAESVYGLSEVVQVRCGLLALC
jgi:hypothetical protein